MSSLSMINTLYDSESDNEVESENGSQEKSCNINLAKLPLPEKALSGVKNPFDVIGDSDKHQGRVGSFQHERGNWATFVCISYAEVSHSFELYQFVTEIISSYLDTNEFDTSNKGKQCVILVL